MSEEEAFLDHIAEAPDDRLRRLVYADWLQERDDERDTWVRDDDMWEFMRKHPDPIAVLMTRLETAHVRSGMDIASYYDVLLKFGPSMIEPIFRRARDWPPDTQYFGVAMLSGLNPEELRPWVSELVGVLDRGLMGWPAARCLGKQPESAILEHSTRLRGLSERLPDDAGIRAAWLLAKFDRASSFLVPCLLRTLPQSRDDILRTTKWEILFESLKWLGDHTLAYFDDFVEWVRNSETSDLARLAVVAMGEGAVGPCIALFESEEIRRAGLQLLRDFGPVAIPALEDAFDGDSLYRRRGAALILWPRDPDRYLPVVDECIAANEGWPEAARVSPPVAESVTAEAARSFLSRYVNRIADGDRTEIPESSQSRSLLKRTWGGLVEWIRRPLS